MWPFKSKFDRLTREEVVDAICSLEKESSLIEEEIVSSRKREEELMEKGKNEKSRDIKLFYAKKINALKAEREQNVQRAMYIMYNVRLLQKLKSAIDDNRFFKNTSKISLGNLLGDQKGLAKFLNKTLNNRINAEQVLTDADETFREIEEAYEKNEGIYGVREDDDELLAMFETEESVENEQEMYSANEKEVADATDE